MGQPLASEATTGAEDNYLTTKQTELNDESKLEIKSKEQVVKEIDAEDVVNPLEIAD